MPKESAFEPGSALARVSALDVYPLLAHLLQVEPAPGDSALLPFKGGLFLIGTAIWGGLWATFALSSSMPLSFVLMGLIGLSASPFGVLQTTLMLMVTEPHVQGRVMGIQELTIGVMPVSSLVLGAAAEIVGIANVALISGTLLAVSLTLLALRVPELLRYSGHNS